MKESYNEDNYTRQSVVDVDSLNITKSSKRDYETLKSRMDDYREACKYMMSTVGDRKKAAEFLDIAENLKKLLDTISKGEKKIDILKADPDVTPSIILGYSEEER